MGAHRLPREDVEHGVRAQHGVVRDLRLDRRTGERRERVS